MKLLVATREPRVFDVLESSRYVGKGKGWEVEVALDTGAIYEAIPEVDLAIVDQADLLPHPFTVEFIRTLLAHASTQKILHECTSTEFLANADRYLSSQPDKRRKRFNLPPHKVIAFTSYSGGTGKTTLALDTALYFAKKTEAVLNLPAAVFEFTYGSSALHTLVGGGGLTLTDLVLQPEVAPYHFHGVALYPMDHRTLHDIPVDQVTRYLCGQIASNALTVIDAGWPHGLLPAIGEEVDLWIVLTTPRVDAVENARKLCSELSETYSENKVIMAVNQMGGLGATLALWGTPHKLEVERLSQEGIFYSGRLGKKILSHLYGGLWDEYERAGKRRRGLFRRFLRRRRVSRDETLAEEPPAEEPPAEEPPAEEPPKREKKPSRRIFKRKASRG
jgi:hypothetical protein